MGSDQIVCWEAREATDPMTLAAAELYEQTLDQDERIPWEWISRSLESPATGRTSGWVKHLLLAAPGDRRTDPKGLAGYAYGSLVPEFGGYLCYLGVAPWARRLGVGTALYTEFFERVSTDAKNLGQPLPFVIWESRRPDLTTPAGQVLWSARSRLFGRVGGLMVDGIEFFSPNYDEQSSPTDLVATVHQTNGRTTRVVRLSPADGSRHGSLQERLPG